MTPCAAREQNTVTVPLRDFPEQNGSLLRVCFVCTGNTCRSPMAAAVANAMARSSRQADAPDIDAVSAGLYAADGDPIAVHAVMALEAAGIEPAPAHDYRRHTAHTLTAEEALQYDLLVGLGGGHCMELLLRFPQAAQKIIGMPKPIADPYGGSLSDYESCLAQITEGVRDLLFSSHETGEEAK